MKGYVKARLLEWENEFRTAARLANSYELDFAAAPSDFLFQALGRTGPSGLVDNVWFEGASEAVHTPD